MQTKTKFKKTLIGEIPEDWEVVRLERVVDIYDNLRVPLSEMERADRKGPYPYCGANGIIDYIDDYIFEGEYILLAEDGGRYGSFEPSAYIMTGKFWVNNHAHVLKAKEGVADNWFILYVLNFLDLTPYVVGSTRKKLNQSHMRKILISLPPLSEQKQIAQILRTVDEAIEKTDLAIEKTERLKKGLMQRLLTRGINLFAINQHKLIKAIGRAFKNRDYAFGREENLVSHLAGYLREEFPNWNIDSEVEKDSRRRRPDIIVHKRGTPFNLFAIEVKKIEDANAIKHDIEKLENLMLGERYRYAEAVFVGFNIKNPDKISSLSEKVNFILVTEDGKIYIKPRERTFKKTEIGEIPEEWRVVRIKDTGKVITGKTPPTSEARYWNGGIPFITPADVGDAPYVYTTNRYVSKEGAEKVGSLLPKDTVLVVCIGSTIGKIALTYQESITNQQINAIICKENITPHYLYYTLLFHSKRLKSWSGTAAVPIIKKSLFEKFKIPLPPLSEQQKIAEILMTVDRKLELLRRRREKLERIKKGLMRDLLTGRRRVRVE
ncbi:restriction endonuclease subunit S [Palaeococcus sp. (in: euryarchaeotes)]